MEVTYRPLLPATQYCPCNWRSTSRSLNSLSQSKQTSPFFRVLFAPYTPLWVNPAPATTDNSPNVSVPPQQADINYRVAFERQRRVAARNSDATAMMASLYTPKGRWQWTHQVSFEDRPEEVPIVCVSGIYCTGELVLTNPGIQLIDSIPQASGPHEYITKV